MQSRRAGASCRVSGSSGSGIGLVSSAHRVRDDFAAAHPTQHRVLVETVAASRAVVVPTAAMADRLTALHDSAQNACIVHIPPGASPTN